MLPPDVCPACQRPFSLATVEPRANDPHGRKQVLVYTHLDGTSCVEPWLKPRVLVIEDDADVRELIAMVLEDGGYEVASVATAEEGMRLISDQRSRPQLVLVDHGVDAARVVNWVEQLASASKPAVVVAAESHPELPSAPSVKAWLPKPFTSEKLTRVCALALGIVK